MNHLQKTAASRWQNALASSDTTVLTTIKILLKNDCICFLNHVCNYLCNTIDIMSFMIFHEPVMYDLTKWGLSVTVSVAVVLVISVFPSWQYFILFQRLIEMCNGHSPTPSEIDEIKFLFTLSAQLRKNPHLIYVYMTQVTCIVMLT